MTTFIKNTEMQDLSIDSQGKVGYLSRFQAAIRLESDRRVGGVGFLLA